MHFSLFDLFLTALLIGHVYLAGMASYLLLLTFAAWRVSTKVYRTRLSPDLQPQTRFIVLIPAHNEESLLPNLLYSLAKQRYPRQLYAVHVVADNCQDNTAGVAVIGGACVHIRQDQQQIGKGYALQWLLREIWREEIPHDAVVIVDADSTVSENFLEVMAHHIQAGENAVQGYYAVSNAGQSWSTSLRYAALAVLHYLRPLGRSAFGFSAGLKGNGMVFSSSLARQHVWSASITEDIEYHMGLLLAKERVAFAPEAVVEGEMPLSLNGSRSQHTRWESGRLHMTRKYVLPVLKEALTSLRSGRYRAGFTLFDAVMEHLIPPFSILAAMNATGWLLSLSSLFLFAYFQFPGLLTGGLVTINLVLAFYAMIGQFIYLMSGLKLVKAPAFVYRSLLYAPVLLIWKLWHYCSVLTNRNTKEWVRTARNEG